MDIEDTIEGCERILNDEFPYLDESDFFMVGSIKEVIEKTKAKKKAYEENLAKESL